MINQLNSLLYIQYQLLIYHITHFSLQFNKQIVYIPLHPEK